MTKRILITVRQVQIKGKWRHWEIVSGKTGVIEFDRVKAIRTAREAVQSILLGGGRSQVKVYNRKGRVSAKWNYPRTKSKAKG